MLKCLQNRLTSRNGLVRKGAAIALRVPKWWHDLRIHRDAYSSSPPIFANSFPKSGTHLLLQIVEGFPNTSNYGEFLSSMTSSFLFRRRSPENAGRVISKFLPGEIIRGHLFFNPANAADLKRNNTVNYFIYRDPRDVVVSEAHYLRSMNRSHRLAPYFRELSSIEAAIELSITGFKPGATNWIFLILLNVSLATRAGSIAMIACQFALRI